MLQVRNSINIILEPLVGAAVALVVGDVPASSVRCYVLCRDFVKSLDLLGLISAVHDLPSLDLSLRSFPVKF